MGFQLAELYYADFGPSENSFPSVVLNTFIVRKGIIFAIFHGRSFIDLRKETIMNTNFKTYTHALN